MATLPLSTEQHRRLIRLLAARRSLLTPLHRETLLDEAGLTAFRTRLDFAVDARIFASQLVRVLQDHGTLAETGQPALVALMHWLREEVAGHEEERAFVDMILAPYATRRPSVERVASLMRSWDEQVTDAYQAPFTSVPSATVRALLTATFSDGELTTFAFDHFRAVYDDFASGMARGAKVQRLVEYAERRGETARLLALVKAANPYQYERIVGEEQP